MILVDTSVWIDHFGAADPLLAERLELDEVACHPLVIEELALGHLPDRRRTLADLHHLVLFPTASHREVLELMDVRGLAGSGVGAAAVHLLASTLLRPGGLLWSRDRRLDAAARELGVAA